MAERVLMKGNEAIAEAAIHGRLPALFRISHHAPDGRWPPTWPRRMPKIGGVFLQAESEIAAINMVYGAAAAGHAGDDLLLQPRNFPEERGAYPIWRERIVPALGGERAAGRPGAGRHPAQLSRTTSRPPRAAATATST